MSPPSAVPAQAVGPLHHVGISVRSLERSLVFYRDLLGFTEQHNVRSHADYLGRLLGHPGVGLHVAMLASPESGVSIELLEYVGVPTAEVDHDHANPGIAHIALRVREVDVIYRRLREAGVSAVSAPVTPTEGPNRGGRIVYLIDPDGVRVELITPPVSATTTTDMAEGGPE